MSKYICPNCRGGFDRPRYNADTGFCPWCNQELNGSYEKPDGPQVVSRVESKSEQSDGLGIFPTIREQLGHND